MTASVDTLLRTLAHERRRQVLSVLRTHSSITLPDLADETVVRDRGVSLADVPSDVVYSVYMELYHRHVPKLAAAGLVRYDQERDLVTLTDLGGDVETRVYEQLAADLE
jgi:DNA-binding transcriptional ArsR family regulator